LNIFHFVNIHLSFIYIAAKEDLKALESMTVATPEYNAKVDKLVAELKAHIVKEETVDLPALMDVLSENEKSHYGVLFEKTKKFAPTRPHPSFPDRPPYEVTFTTSFFFD